MSTSSSLVGKSNESFELSEEARADDQYVVEKILAKRKNRKGRWEYLLKWAGFGDEDNTWEAQGDIHPDLIADFERQQIEADALDPIYTSLGDDSINTTQKSLSKSNSTSTPPAKKKRKTSSASQSNSSISMAHEPKRKVYGVEKGWRVRAVIGAAKQKDSSVLYAVDYVQGSPVLREYIPSEIAHIYIPRELIEFFQKKIVWNSSSNKTKS